MLTRLTHSLTIALFLAGAASCGDLQQACSEACDATNPEGLDIEGDSVTGEELPGEELPTEELPVEELPVEELPVEELRTGCVPDHDGVITMAEMRAVAGESDNHLLAFNATIDSVGTTTPSGRHWDLSEGLPGEMAVVSTLEPLAGQWFAEDFPTGTYSVDLLGGGGLLGVYEVTEDAVLILGFVSKSDDFLSNTVMAYDTPVVAFQNPMAELDSWQSFATATGHVSAIPAVYEDSWTSTVDAAGVLTTPEGDLEVLRVTTELTRTYGFTVTTQRYHLYLSECRGLIAAVSSYWNETENELSAAAEVMRVSP